MWPFCHYLHSAPKNEILKEIRLTAYEENNYVSVETGTELVGRLVVGGRMEMG